MTKTFYYFGFGSNLLAKRIHIQNPTAKRIGVGRLTNYRLDFLACKQAETWRGAVATIVPTPDAHVYGAIWEIGCENLKDLDHQEGVNHGIYVPVHVPVLSLADDTIIECRAYHLTDQPNCDLREFSHDQTPYTRQPSYSYLKTIVKGAMESGVPKEYILWLCYLKHNGKTVEHFEKLLDLGNINLENNKNCSVVK